MIQFLNNYIVDCNGTLIEVNVHTGSQRVLSSVAQVGTEEYENKVSELIDITHFVTQSSYIDIDSRVRYFISNTSTAQEQNSAE